MAKKNKTGKDKQQQPAKGKPAGAKKQTQAADKKTAAQGRPAQIHTAEPPREPLPPFFTPVNIAAFAAGLALLGMGAFKFYSIQYAKAPTGDRIYLQGFILFCAGVILPCLGVAPLRKILFPGHKPDSAQSTGQNPDSDKS